MKTYHLQGLEQAFVLKKYLIKLCCLLYKFPIPPFYDDWIQSIK